MNHRSRPDTMRRYVSPLRYPGGKARMASFLGDVFAQFDLSGVEVWMEPFAGGAGAGLTLLDAGRVDEVWLVEKNPALAAFWMVATTQGDRLAAAVKDLRPDLALWHRAKETVAAAEAGDTVDDFDLGLAAFLVNRCSRSGIITAAAGPIGGKHQTSKWTLADRFDAGRLAARLLHINHLSPRIRVFQADAVNMIEELNDSGVGEEVFLFVDPPYVVEGGRLYSNGFDHNDHVRLAQALTGCEAPWMLTYDNHPLITGLYPHQAALLFDISYTANSRRTVQELAVFSNNCPLPQRMQLLPAGDCSWVHHGRDAAAVPHTVAA